MGRGVGISGSQGFGCRREGTEDFQDSETMLNDILTVDNDFMHSSNPQKFTAQKMNFNVQKIK